MATRYFCDRCDAQIEQERLIQITLTSPIRTYEICGTCLEALHNFLIPGLRPAPGPAYAIMPAPMPPPGPVTCKEGALPTIEPGILLEQAVETGDEDVPF